MDGKVCEQQALRLGKRTRNQVKAGQGHHRIAQATETVNQDLSDWRFSLQTGSPRWKLEYFRANAWLKGQQHRPFLPTNAIILRETRLSWGPALDLQSPSANPNPSGRPQRIAITAPD